MRISAKLMINMSIVLDDYNSINKFVDYTRQLY